MIKIENIFKDWDFFKLKESRSKDQSYSYGVKKNNITMTIDGVCIDNEYVIINEFNYGKSKKEVKINNTKVENIGELLEVYLEFIRLIKENKLKEYTN